MFFISRVRLPARRPRRLAKVNHMVQPPMNQNGCEIALIRVQYYVFLNSPQIYIIFTIGGSAINTVDTR